jgi:apolipoprotein N-acyltransferase
MRIQYRVLLVAGSAGLGALSFPPIGWWPLALIAWLPFWLGIHGAGGLHGFRLGLLHGMVLYGLTLAWFWNIFGALAMGLWLILAAFTGLAASIFGGVSARKPGIWWLPLLAATAWTGIEFFRSEWFHLSFPWITPGTAIGPTALSPLLGVYAASFLLMVSACGLACRRRWTGCLAMLLVLALVIWRPRAEDIGQGAVEQVVAVQGEALDFHSYLERTREDGVMSATVVWPEYAAMYFAGPTANPWGDAINLCKEKHLTLVFGTLRQDITGKPRKFNEALTVDASGVLGVHVKNRPVHLMDDGVKGKSTVPVATAAGYIATPICFDCDTQWVCRRMVANGAEWIAAPTMDALHWGASQRLQHAEMFRHRAAENGRWVVVAATSGLTQIIDPTGNRRAELPWPAEGVLHGSIARRTTFTPFTLGGWLFGPLCFAGMLATAGMALKRPKAALAG